MAISDGTTMLVSPTGNNGFDGMGSGWWIILLFVLLGGWNNGFGGNNGYTNNEVQRGFDQSAVMNGINNLNTSVSNGFSNVQQSLCGGFAGVNATVNGAQSAVTQQLYTNQIADLERSFAAQTASTQGMTAIQGQLAQCCCDNRLATANLQAVIQSENCADRVAISDGIRDLLTATQAQNQKILDKLCDQELMAERRENDQLRAQLNMANLAASQNAQTAQLIAGNTAQTQYIVNRVAPYPTPSYIVTNPNGSTSGCGCGCGSF